MVAIQPGEGWHGTVPVKSVELLVDACKAAALHSHRSRDDSNSKPARRFCGVGARLLWRQAEAQL